MYRVYLIDFDGASIELDTEDIDFGLEFRISNLTDLSLRSGSRTKEVTFKGTNKNNNAFGYIYRLNRTSDLKFDNKLFFNLNSLRQVDCLIYADFNLVFRGTLRLLETTRQKGIIYYKTVITDSVIDLMKFTQEKLLTDLDLSDLKHRYTAQNIINSWSTSTERFINGTFSQVPFSMGSGYTYPSAFYGLTPSPTLDNENIFNIRPALFVEEIIDRIFAQPGLTGFSWELKSEGDIKDKFKSLIIPNSQDKLKANIQGYQQRLTRCGLTMSSYFVDFDSQVSFGPGTNRAYLYFLNMLCSSLTPSNTTLAILRNIEPEGAIWEVDQTITCDASAQLDYQFTTVSGTTELTFDFAENLVWNPASRDGWNSLGVTNVFFATASTTYTGTLNLYIPKREFIKGRKLALRAFVQGLDYTQTLNATASLRMPFTTTQQVSIDIQYGNELTPVLKENIKQYDFLKALMLMFNMYAYAEKSRPKHIIFQTYDDFYAFTQPQFMKQVALDWSQKLSYTDDWKKVFNLTIPKSYLYTFRDDSDYINADYKKNYNAVYGQLRFADIYGIVDEKKVEVLFSPSPMTFVNEKRMPTIRGGDDNTLNIVNSNIRIQYYNGQKPCTAYTLTYGASSSSGITFYGEQSEYYRPSTTELEVMQFGLPRKLYFPEGINYVLVPNLYKNYHQNQTTDLTSEDLYTIECKMMLNNVDIANFDFRIPVYLTTDIGNSYYKVLEIDWKDYKTPATVKLQAIAFETAVTSTQSTTTTSTTTTTTTAASGVIGTQLNITKTGWLKYLDTANITQYEYVSSTGTYSINNCHYCSTITGGFPYSDLATWNNLICGTAC